MNIFNPLENSYDTMRENIGFYELSSGQETERFSIATKIGYFKKGTISHSNIVIYVMTALSGHTINSFNLRSTILTIAKTNM